MASYVIWLDSHEGKVFRLSADGKSSQHLHTHGHKHHDQPHGKNSGGHHPEAETLYKDLSESIKDAKETLLIGPADSKIHFKKYLEKHFASTLAKTVVGVETVDHPTDNQILEKARKFFKVYDQYKG